MANGNGQTHYDVLGVSPDATSEAIKQAYDKRAREVDPDKGGDSEQFYKLNSAFDILSDPLSRCLYESDIQSSTDFSLPQLMDKETPAPKKNSSMLDLLSLSLVSNQFRHVYEWVRWAKKVGVVLMKDVKAGEEFMQDYTNFKEVRWFEEHLNSQKFKSPRQFGAMLEAQTA